MDRQPPPRGSTNNDLVPAVTARLVTSAPEGLLRLDFSAPPSGTWTLVRAELARRLAEQAVSRAAAVNDADLAAFAVGRGLRGESPPAAARVGAASATTAAESPVARSAGAAGSRVATLRRFDMLTGQALAERLGVSRATVALRRSAGRLLALESGAKRGFRYPGWQVEIVADSPRSELFEAVLRVLRPRGAWAAHEFMTNASPSLGGRTPLEVFLAGDLGDLRRVLDRFADQPSEA